MARLFGVVLSLRRKRKINKEVKNGEIKVKRRIYLMKDYSKIRWILLIPVFGVIIVNAIVFFD